MPSRTPLNWSARCSAAWLRAAWRRCNSAGDTEGSSSRLSTGESLKGESPPMGHGSDPTLQRLTRSYCSLYPEQNVASLLRSRAPAPFSLNLVSSAIKQPGPLTHHNASMQFCGTHPDLVWWEHPLLFAVFPKTHSKLALERMSGRTLPSVHARDRDIATCRE